MFYVIFLVSSTNREVRPRHLSQLKMSKGKCPLCDVQWKPKSSDIWGPSITSLNEMPIKMQSHVFKPFKEASVAYTNKYVVYSNCEGVNIQILFNKLHATVLQFRYINHINDIIFSIKYNRRL